MVANQQSLTKRFGAGVWVSESAYREIPNPEKYCCRQVDVVQVKGKTQPVTIYEFFDADPQSLKQQEIQSLHHYQQGLQCFQARDWETAAALFTACLEMAPDDPISRLYLERCRAHLENPLATAWNGVTILQEK